MPSTLITMEFGTDFSSRSPSNGSSNKQNCHANGLNCWCVPFMILPNHFSRSFFPFSFLFFPPIFAVVVVQLVFLENALKEDPLRQLVTAAPLVFIDFARFQLLGAQYFCSWWISLFFLFFLFFILFIRADFIYIYIFFFFATSNILCQLIFVINPRLLLSHRFLVAFLQFFFSFFGDGNRIFKRKKKRKEKWQIYENDDKEICWGISFLSLTLFQFWSLVFTWPLISINPSAMVNQAGWQETIQSKYER